MKDVMKEEIIMLSKEGMTAWEITGEFCPMNPLCEYWRIFYNYVVSLIK